MHRDTEPTPAPSTRPSHGPPTPAADHAPAPVPAGPPPVRAARLADEDGSLLTEYGLVAVVGATIAGLVVTWASGGAIADLLTWLLARVRDLVAA